MSYLNRRIIHRHIIHRHIIHRHIIHRHIIHRHIDLHLYMDYATSYFFINDSLSLGDPGCIKYSVERSSTRWMILD